MSRRRIPLLLALVLAACRGKEEAPPTPAGPETVVASTDPAATIDDVPAPPAPLAAAARVLCDRMAEATQNGFAWDTSGIRIRTIRDTVVEVAASREWRAACGLEFIGGVRPEQLAGRSLVDLIPGEDWGYEPGFGADGPTGSQFAVRRPGAYCVIDEEWEAESDDPADSLLPPPVPAFRILIRCAGADPIPPEWAPTEPPDFDPASVVVGPAGAECRRYPGVTLLIRPLAGIRADRITVRATTAATCDPEAADGDYDVPMGMLPRFLGLKDGVIFLETGQLPQVSELVLIEASDRRFIYQGPAAAIVGPGPGGAIGVYRPASLAIPHPLCERMNIDLPRIDSLFWVDIHSGRARFAGATHCPSYQ